MIGADAIRGHIDLILLAILETRPSYAYEISRTITDRSRGEYLIKQTTLYTALKRLQSQGQLEDPAACRVLKIIPLPAPLCGQHLPDMGRTALLFRHPVF